jgi:hypothetical protein
MVVLVTVVVIICGMMINFISSCMVCGTAHHFFKKNLGPLLFVHITFYFPSICFNIPQFPSWYMEGQQLQAAVWSNVTAC